MDKRIVVPEGMLKAAQNAALGLTPEQCFGEPTKAQIAGVSVEAALRWLDGELERQRLRVAEMEERARCRRHFWQKGYNAAIGDVRRMFLAKEPEPDQPEPEVPEAVKDILNRAGLPQDGREWITTAIIEAYCRGFAEWQRLLFLAPEPEDKEGR